MHDDDVYLCVGDRAFAHVRGVLVLPSLVLAVLHLGLRAWCCENFATTGLLHLGVGSLGVIFGRAFDPFVAFETELYHSASGGASIECVGIAH